MKKEIPYPAEITFKGFFSYHPEIRDAVMAALGEDAADATVTLRASKNGKFIACTITAVFESEEILNETCSRVCSIRGFVMMI